MSSDKIAQISDVFFCRELDWAYQNLCPTSSVFNHVDRRDSALRCDYGVKAVSQSGLSWYLESQQFKVNVVSKNVLFLFQVLGMCVSKKGK